MKGIVMQIGDQKSIVLFNNGKIGEIPTPPHCEEGMVVAVSYNRRLIALAGIAACVALLCAIFALRSAYYAPFGYVQINYGDAAVELAYNRFGLILAVRPLNFPAVEPIATLSLSHATIEAAYAQIMQSFALSAPLPQHGAALIRIAQDDLMGAKKIERALSAVPGEFDAAFELYTHELYGKVMAAGAPRPGIDEPPMRGGWNQGMRGRRMWCW